MSTLAGLSPSATYSGTSAWRWSVTDLPPTLFKQDGGPRRCRRTNTAPLSTYCPRPIHGPIEPSKSSSPCTYHLLLERVTLGLSFRRFRSSFPSELRRRPRSSPLASFLRSLRLEPCGFSSRRRDFSEKAVKSGRRDGAPAASRSSLVSARFVPSLAPARTLRVLIPAKGLLRKSSEVGAPGFEPGTSCSQSRRATGLRHTPNTRKNLTRKADRPRPQDA